MTHEGVDMPFNKQINESINKVFPWISSTFCFFQVDFDFRKEKKVARGDIWGIWWLSDMGNCVLGQKLLQKNH